MKISQRAFSWALAMVAVAILGLGSAGVVIVVRSNLEQRNNLAAQGQRATYTTFQQEIVTHGIDPTRVVNPLGALADPSVSSGGSGTSVGNVSVTTVSANSNPGGPVVTGLDLTGAGQTGERGGGTGLTTVVGGTPLTTTTTTLAAPSFVVSLPLTSASFPATGWVLFPSNPVGTVYRYTTDGSNPTATSSVWNLSAATAITAANFPAALKMAAFNTDPAYNQSAVATLTPTMKLPGVVMTRYAGGSSTVFSYSDMTSAPANGMMLALASSIAGVTTTIRYTVDGSDPATSPSAQTYGSNFIVPFANWTGPANGPLTATVLVAVTATGSKYIATTSTILLTNLPQQLAAPVFSFASSAGAVAEGTTLGFTASSGATIRYAKWTSPTSASTAANSITLP